MSAPEQEAPTRFTTPTVRWTGPQAFLLECVSLQDVMRLHTFLKDRPFLGQREVIAAAETVLLVFRTRGEALAASRAVTSLHPPALGETQVRTVTVDVLYDGEDLAEVAAHLGMSVEALIAAHTATEWFGGFGGFAPGFTYCTALTPPFDVPRRSTPRTSVAAGSVAIAGQFSAVYPRSSPGGWQLLGRTDAVLWDLTRPEPALIRPGDKVRYRAVREFLDAGGPAEVDEAAEHPTPGVPQAPAQGLTVVDPGMQSLLQDLGRHGFGDLGVSPSGAADRTSARQANRLVGNPSTATVVETLLGGLTLRAHGTQVLALAGAEGRPVITGADETTTRPAPIDRPFALLDGETLTIGEPHAGVRTYLALRGGFQVPTVLGSTSTDVLSGVGPEPLSAGMHLERHADPGRALVGDPEPPVRVTPRAGRVTELRVLLGPRDDWFDAENRHRFITQEWIVTPESNRVGVRLAAPETGAPLARSKEGELASEGVFSGALQVPPSGLPVLFLADHPVTGGYPVIAVVVPEDLGAAAQLPPGARVRFRPVVVGETAQHPLLEKDV